MYLTQFDQIRNNIRHNLAFDDQITSDESRKRGKELRNQTPRSTHAAWNTPENRPSPVSLLLSQAESRVPELLPIRYERMSESPFAFYRGSALIMANDPGLHTQFKHQSTGLRRCPHFQFRNVPIPRAATRFRYK